MKSVTPKTTLVILLGASSWPQANLDGGPVFENSAYDLRDYFLSPTGFALPESQLLDLFDGADSPSEILVKTGDFLEDRTSHGRFHDLFVYYVGHGSFHGARDSYYLALKGTRAGRERVTSLRVEDLASEIRSHTRHLRRYVFFDCCFAGNAATIFQSSQNQRAARKTREAFQKGTLVYCSSGKDTASKAPRVTRHTMFTGSLLNALQHGKVEFPASLTMVDVDLLVRQHIAKTFDEAYAVRPELHSPDQQDGDLREVPLFPNRAIAQTTISGKKVKNLGQMMIASKRGGELYINGIQTASLEPNEYFKTDPIPAGDYQISFGYPDKPPLEDIIQVKPGQTTQKILQSPLEESPEVSLPLEEKPPSRKPEAEVLSEVSGPQWEGMSSRKPRPNARRQPRWLTANRFAWIFTILVFGAIFYWKSLEDKPAENQPDDLETQTTTQKNPADSNDPKAPEPGEVKVFREAGLEVSMVWCPPGAFTMGSPTSEKGRGDDEAQHEVTLTRGFWLAQTELTQAQWNAVRGKNPSYFKGDDLPVEQVSWEDAQEFIKRLNQKLGKQLYRLPTEAEWEYACRAGTTTPFNTGENLTTDQANYNGDHPYADFEKGINRQKSTPVMTFPPNAWNLYDLHGNVLEWCSDWRGSYAEGMQVDPPGPENGQERVLRGGSWFSLGEYCRSANRDDYSPGFALHGIGFRLARDHEL